MLEPPIDVDEETARQLLQQELAKAEYTQASPTWLDVVINDFWAWVNDILQPIEGVPGGFSPVALIIGAVVVLGVLALLFGRPILAQRAARRRATVGDLFDGDARTAEQLRASAAAAARAGDYETAVIEQFRGIARAMHERTVISVSPGMTASGVAGASAGSFPAHAEALARAAAVFDGARYLGLGAEAPDWALLAELDAALGAAEPRLATKGAPV